MRVLHANPRRAGGRLGIAVLVVVALGVAGGACGQAFSEFLVPTVGSAPVGIAAGTDGALWFTETAGNKIGRITTTGAFTEFAVPTASSHPGRIASGSDGALWFTEFNGNKIGRITVAGAITEFAVPTASSTPYKIAAGPDGALWFTELDGNKIGRITTAGVITEFAIPTPSSQPPGITAGPDGALWFTESSGNKIGRITTGGVITEFAVPTPNSGPGVITAGPDGALWFDENNGNRIGKITTAGAITEFAVPTASSGPFGIAAGPDGALWFTEFNSNKIGRITTAGVITEFSIPTASSQPGGIAAGPDGALWFAEFNGNKIGRISVPGTCDASTLCLGGNRFLVTASWQSPTASGQGHAVSLTSDTGYFWFFNSTNVEMVVKVLNACGINQRFWVFAGGLTNVQVDLTVTDTLTASVKTYRNPQNTPFQPIQDTAAFATCAANVASLAMEGVEATADAPPPLERMTPSSRILSLTSADTEQACTADTTTLCLSGGRFRVQAHWATPDGRTGEGQAISLTSDTGYFWFFSSTNVEMIVKVLDACSINGRKWVFAGGLTNVSVVLTVTDTQTGAVRTYVNPQSTPFQPIQDTSAFSTCP
jgi:streptogramin lyase